MSSPQSLLSSLHAADAEFDAAIEAVPAGSRDRRPAPDVWSATEVVEHLAIVNHHIAALLAPAVEEARAAGLMADQDDDPPATRLDEASLIDRTNRLTASEASQPTGLDASAARAALAAARTALDAIVESAGGLALTRIVRPHRRLGPLNLEQWMTFVVAHERRHALQLDEIAAMLAAH